MNDGEKDLLILMGVLVALAAVLFGLARLVFGGKTKPVASDKPTDAVKVTKSGK